MSTWTDASRDEFFHFGSAALDAWIWRIQGRWWSTVKSLSCLVELWMSKYRLHLQRMTQRAELLQHLYLLLSVPMTLALSQARRLFLLQWSEMSDFVFSCSAFSFIAHVKRPDVCFPHSFWCSFFQVLKALPVSPMYVSLHVAYESTADKDTSRQQQVTLLKKTTAIVETCKGERR